MTIRIWERWKLRAVTFSDAIYCWFPNSFEIGKFGKFRLQKLIGHYWRYFRMEMESFGHLKGMLGHLWRYFRMEWKVFGKWLVFLFSNSRARSLLISQDAIFGFLERKWAFKTISFDFTDAIFRSESTRAFRRTNSFRFLSRAEMGLEKSQGLFKGMLEAFVTIGDKLR